jgi:hypothetical protein
MEAEDFLLANEDLDLDFQMLVAVERISTGANAHNLRGLANAYVLACANDRPTKAEGYRIRLRRELLRRTKSKDSVSNRGARG